MIHSFFLPVTEPREECVFGVQLPGRASLALQNGNEMLACVHNSTVSEVFFNQP